MRQNFRSLFLAALGALAPLAGADVFDLQNPNDDTLATENELIHRTEQRHDLAARLPGPTADIDLYRLVVRPYSSYEVVVDETSGDIGPTLLLERLASDGSLVQSSAGVSAIGYNRTLRFENTTAFVSNQYVRVRSGACTITCDTTAVYRIRAFDTTGFIPRFYDHGTIRTVVVVQNPTNATVNGRVYYWGGHNAALLATDTFTLAARASVAIQPNPLLLAPCGPDSDGCAGHVTVTSDASYGELRAKASQMDSDPALPDSWDHEMIQQP